MLIYLRKTQFLYQKCHYNAILNIFYMKRLYSNRNDNEDNDKPVKYTTSDAHIKHKSYETFRISDEELHNVPVIERPIVLFSVAFFFLYFAYLRESNDYDEKLNASLYDNVPNVERPMIEVAIKRFESQGMDTRQLRERLKELQDLEREKEREMNILK